MKYPRYSRFVYGVMCNTPTAHHFYEDLLSSSLRINNPCESWLILVYPITIHYHKQCVPYFFPQNPWSSENQSMFSSSKSLWQNHFSQLVHNLFGVIRWDQIFHFLGVAVHVPDCTSRLRGLREGNQSLETKTMGLSSKQRWQWMAMDNPALIDDFSMFSHSNHETSPCS